MLNSVIRWNPAAASMTSRDPLFRLVDNFFANGMSEDVANRTWTPPVDIQETEEGYRLTAELPGLTKEDIQITLEDNVLRLSGERKLEKNADKDSYHRIERVYGVFTRAFTLPSQVNGAGVTASFENGVLTIQVPKAEQARPRKISIS
ncbi:MAG TPA: Hsp20/alpha crystallin family protein [Thermoanaerobaculia bacterium]|nr:Hsp20/alpha crystallin family protein [Thermoanaerobaculia bacterium]